MPLPQVTIFGTINKIELRYSQQGMAICSFQIECSEKNKKGEWDNLYIKGTTFDKSAEFVNQWFKDGDLCIATGKLVTEVYEKDGSKRYEIKLKFPQIEFPPKAKKQDDNGYQMPEPQYEDHPQKQQPKHTDYQPKKQPMPQHDGGALPDMYEDEIPFAPIGLQYKNILHCC